MRDEQVLKLLDDPEGFVRQIAQTIIAERQVEPPGPEVFMSVKSAARYLDVPEATIRKWLQRGQVNRYKVRGCVRVKVAELIEQR